MGIWPGRPYPLSATHDGSGTNFALYLADARKVELCLVDGDGLEMNCLELAKIDGHVRHGYVPNLRPGQYYGYRIYGSCDLVNGKRFNPSKLLLGPHVKAIADDLDGDMSIFTYPLGNPDGYNNDDPATHATYSVVINPFFDWGNDRHPGPEYPELATYETHVKGMTILNPTISERLHSIYARIGHPKNVEYLQYLGINVLELMPIHQFATDPPL